MRAYPRWRGETEPLILIGSDRQGLSPLARGNPRPLGAQDGASGPIPAGAGKPAYFFPARPALGAYPRWRGETGSWMSS